MGTSCSICLRTKETFLPNTKLSDLKLLEQHSLKLPRGDLPSYLTSHQASMPSKLLVLFAKVLDDSASTESTVDLRFTHLKSNSLLHFTKILPFFENLKVLKLWKTSLGPEGLSALKELIPRFRLEVLSLEDNHLGPQGAFILIGLFARLKTLRELWLQINSIGREGALAMAEDLHLLRRLELLAMDENDIGDEGANALARTFASLPELHTVSLNQNFLTKGCIRDIIQRIRTLPRAVKVNLKGNLKDEELGDLLKDTNDSIVLK